MIPATATGVLRSLAEQDELDLADVHVARRLGALVGETSEQALLAVALLVRNLREGSVRLDLSEHPSVAAALEGSPLLDGPLVREGDWVWLDTYHRYEVFVAGDLLARVSRTVPLDADKLAALFPVVDDQARAARVCAGRLLSVLSGGPGTGKTATVARLLLAVREPGMRVALAAPTGKAAARLRESLVSAFGVPDEDRPWLEALPCTTLHRLLGVRRGSSEFRHNAGNRLPYDVVVVDEASMVSLALFARLLEALRPDCRLLLVGDPEQLASVEAGAVLADVVAGTAMAPAVAELAVNHRFPPESGIARLAAAVKTGDVAGAEAVVASGPQDVTFFELPDEAELPVDVLRPLMVAQLSEVIDAARAGDSTSALAALDRHRVLCAHRSGPRGLSWFDRQVPQWLQHDLGLLLRRDGRFVGQPLLVRSNDYDNKLWNGDTGLVVEVDGELVAAFPSQLVPLGRLGDVRPLYAMTVHQAQGSQFGRVTVVLPPAASRLATREMLYTGVTRTEKHVSLMGSPDAFRRCVGKRSIRATGLDERLSPT